MKPKRIPNWIPYLIALCTVFGFATVLYGTESASPGPPQEGAVASPAKTESLSSLEDVIFERLEGKERITFVVSKLTGYNVARESAETLAVRLENVQVPPDKIKKLDDVTLRSVDRIVATHETVDGRTWAYFKINMREMAPYVVKDEANKVFVDIDVSAIAEKKPAEERRDVAKAENVEKAYAPSKNGTRTTVAGERQYTGQKLTVDFQDANIKNVFRLIAEASGLNIVSGDDVKGTVTMQLREVPWDQALETIMDAHGLGMKRTGNVITVLSADKIKKAEEMRLKEAVSRGKLPQISIEAQIVEASETFIRKLGVQWGAGALGSWGSSQVGALGGSAGYAPTPTSLPNAISTYLSNPPYSAGTGVGVTNSSLAVNFPGFFSGVPTFGVIAGSGKYILDAQLHALESTTEGRIISSPKVTTLDGIKATIKQGEEIPYVIESVSGGVVTRTVQFKEAVLKLDVKPSVTPEGKIAMEVKANNDFADYTRSVLGNPPINKEEVDSTVVVKDGDTLVIGGIRKLTEQKTVAGVPWFMKIPALGWLFKAEDINNTKREILIFVTPKILREAEGLVKN
ncbi:MAG: secretin and TonB N-terminal domain-containing protein [Deltaproteobacteria bacterium]|nr:secretin and TonB N-terminal domain-containing protein [Deltaproteobacteria bacterium]